MASYPAMSQFETSLMIPVGQINQKVQILG